MIVFVRALALASVTAVCATAAASVPTSHNSAPTTAKMQFKLASNGGASCCEWIAAEGEITKQTPNDFKAFLKEWKTWGALEGHTIRLNSPGGDLIAGVELGELFRSGRFSTEVGSNQALPPVGLTHPYEKTRGVCMSACAYAFLGGINRSASVGEIGFHQFYSALPANGASAPSAADSASKAQTITGVLAEYLKEMNIDPEVLVLASVTPSANLVTPNEPTMARLRITTSHNDVQFSGWAIEPYRAGAVVTGTVNDQKNQQTKLTFFCRQSNPGQVFLLASWIDLIPRANEAESQTDSIRSAVFGSKLIIGQTTVREQQRLEGITDARVDDEGRYYFTYALSMDEFNRGLQAGFAVVVDVPHVYSSDMSFLFQPPLAGLPQSMAIAFKSCL